MSKRKLFSVTSRIASEISAALLETLGKSIWHLSETDRYRLFKLWVWKERYFVTYEYILSVLVPYFNNGVEKRTGKKSKGLGISIPVLTGNVAEEFLKKCIAKDFPDADNISLYRDAEKDRIAAILSKSEFKTRVRSSLQYKSIAAEVASYTKSVTKTVQANNKLATKMKKLPFRNNPWI